MNSPTKSTILIATTCQGNYIANMLRASRPLTEKFEIINSVNYKKAGVFSKPQFADESLKKCKLFIYHKVRNPDNFKAIQELLDNLPVTSVIPLPYITSNLYWPLFDTTAAQPIYISEEYPFGLLPYRNALLDLLIDKNIPIAEIINIFTTQVDLSSLEDLDLLQKQTFTYWESRFTI